MPTAFEPSKRGRPRDPRIDEAVLKAALQTFREQGYPDASLLQIARRAGVGAPSLYRRWSAKWEIALDLISFTVPTQIAQTDDLRRDLTEYAIERIRVFADPSFAHLMLALSTMAMRTPTIAQRLRQAFETDINMARNRLELAIGRGELPPSSAVDLAAELLLGAVAIPFMFTGRPRPAEDAARVVDAILDGIIARSNGHHSKKPNKVR